MKVWFDKDPNKDICIVELREPYRIRIVLGGHHDLGPLDLDHPLLADKPDLIQHARESEAMHVRNQQPRK